MYGCITVDPDLNITVELSLDSAFAADSPYNTTISIQCTPTFDSQARDGDRVRRQHHREEDGGGVMIGKNDARAARETARLPRRHDGGGAGGSVHRGAGRHDARHHGDGVGNCFGPKPAGAERSYAAEASLFDSSVPLQEVFVTIPDSEEATRIKVNVYQSGGYAYYEEGR